MPERNLLTVPDGISDTEAIFTEPLAAAYGITEQVDIDKKTSVAVIGDGKLGILCAWSLAKKTERLFLVGKHQKKLKLAQRENVEGVLLDNVDQHFRMYDIVVEATGSKSGFETALNLLKPRGKLVLKSTFHGMSEWPAWRVVVDEITVVGSRCGIFEPALELLNNTDIDVESLVSAEFPISRALEAIDEAGQRGVLKVVLDMGAG